MKPQENDKSQHIPAGVIDTNALDTPPVDLPDLPCAHVGCPLPGTLMIRQQGKDEYTFWCEGHAPKPPVLIPPGGNQ